MTDKKDTRFKPGQSGNPGGRPPGSGWVGKARKELQSAWDGEMADGSDGIRAKLIASAKAGDAWAIRIIAERVCPPIKASEALEEIQLTGDTLTDKATSVLDAMAQGEIAPSQASQLLQGIGAMAKILETDELARRLEALEELAKQKGGK